jgi:hypothetical protein
LALLHTAKRGCSRRRPTIFIACDGKKAQTREIACWRRRKFNKGNENTTIGAGKFGRKRLPNDRVAVFFGQIVGLTKKGNGRPGGGAVHAYDPSPPPADEALPPYKTTTPDAQLSEVAYSQENNQTFLMAK